MREDNLMVVKAGSYQEAGICVCVCGVGVIVVVGGNSFIVRKGSREGFTFSQKMGKRA